MLDPVQLLQYETGLLHHVKISSFNLLLGGVAVVWSRKFRDLKISDGDINENVISKYNFALS